ncbi:hypothetical protein G7084_04105 [Weissella coleopterorum]|uniref:Uncharacterized protein n=1 Tax=Weissella coleopterorum TaxID=2714949 RepID=A0A6G8B002_9LACO|nr:hypothetical protein [Weissella coleopterorum]QIL50567.1 hypothetical protein G7084_04105 [Weissella coleopterorum]
MKIKLVVYLRSQKTTCNGKEWLGYDLMEKLNIGDKIFQLIKREVIGLSAVTDTAKIIQLKENGEVKDV